MSFIYLEDYPLAPLSRNKTRAIKTGTWKYIQPRYLDKTPPCAHACPTGNDISKAFHLLALEKIDEAARLWLAGNPLPAVLGRVCPHPCEDDCNRMHMGGSITIRALERFLGDYLLEKGVEVKPGTPTGKGVAIIGSGPAGLSAAYFLKKRGYEVSIFEKEAKAGGWLRYGIPSYRLPKKILDGELKRLKAMGIQFFLQQPMTSFGDLQYLQREYQAIFISTGFHKPRAMGIEGEEGEGVYVGTEVLHDLLSGKKLPFKGRVVVVGGGNTAMDVARSLRRLGCEVTVVYRRTQAEMPAIAEEVTGAMEEGVQFQFLTQPVEVVREKGRFQGLRCIKMKLGDVDASGRRKPVPIPNSAFFLEAASCIKAIGEEADLSFIREEIQTAWGIKINDMFETPIKGIFAGGDVATGMGTVTHAIGDGKRAALAIDHFLKGNALSSLPPSHMLISREKSLEVVGFQKLNTAYFQTIPRKEPPTRGGAERIEDFQEFIQTLKQEQAIQEARRCFICGTCNECMNCYFLCPDVSIMKNEVGFSVDYDHCKGCGICVAECPRSAMLMEEV